MVDTLRQSPSGPELLIDTTVGPGEVLGLPITASSSGPAEPLTGAEVGALTRYEGTFLVALGAGTTNNLAVPDGSSTVNVTSLGGNATLTGFAISGRGNAGARFTLRKSASSSILTLAHRAGSAAGNQISCPGGTDYQLTSANDAVELQAVDDGTGVVFQVVDRLVPATGVAAPIDSFVVLEQWVFPFAAGPGGAPDDVVMAVQVPFSMAAVDVAVDTAVAVPGSNIQLRSGPGATGAFLSDNISTGTAGITTRNNAANSQTTTTGLYIRRSDSGIGGTVILTVSRN